MLCENCHKKQAIMHMVCLVGDKQIDKWLCGDCAKDYLPMGMGDMPLTPEGAKRFLDEMLKGAGRKPKKKVTREGFSEAAAKVLELATTKALDCGSEHIGTEHILWGLLTIQDCTGKKLLHKLHNNLDEMKTELESWLDKGSKQSKLPQYSQRAQRVMER
ncbi:Clp protease N-terminal domain-containing protein, partial [Phascolarctobacterium succinatutens]